MKCDFKVGDKVIRADGLVGEIDRISRRRHYNYKWYLELHIKYVDGTGGYISSEDRKFDTFYQIGDRVFGNSFLNGLLRRHAELKADLQEIERRIAVMQALKEKKDGE